ncbi:hypothetical protein GWI33_003760 [Rhynchophorus ferrugineus]|uniref:TIR domain-containing protein n=1 Tax=Rhynchophorus ferrugineus TaxID=354439 RepID=A0A834MFS4_RHYFE|nr:hypothetical protein GWI33_003760 [Rhynchophorus ferrugineus]
MCNRRWLFLTLLVIQCIYLVTSISCPKTSKCECIPRTNEMILKCSKGEHELVVKPNDDIRISCISFKQELKATELPALNMRILKKFNMTNIQNLLLENSTHSNVSKSFFTGINQLEKLTINFGHPTLEYDFLESLSSLIKLRLSANCLKMITWSMKYLHNLDYLDLSRNDITILPDETFENLKTLKTLLLWENSIEQLSNNTFIGLGHLETLRLDNNNISVLPKGLLIYLSALKRINFSNNKIAELLSDTFNMNPNLINVNLDNNEISILGDYLFANFSTLTRIDLNSNKLVHIPENIFTNSSSLTDIELQNNNLQNIPEKLFCTLKSLAVINLSNNNLTKIHKMTFVNLANLKALFLENNHIMSISGISFWHNTHLRILNLSGNKLISMDASLCHQANNALADLDISRNYLTNVTHLKYENCSKLEKIYLHWNKITNMSCMEILPSFKIVDLSFNNITEVMVEHFVVPFYDFMTLNVSHNQIERLNFQNVTDRIRKIKSWNKGRKENILLDIRNNPIICDCRNYYLFDYNNLDTLNLKQFMKIDQEGLICQYTNKTWMVNRVNVSTIYCKTQTRCPENCTCVARPTDKALIIDCSSQNLTIYPQFELSPNDRYPLNQTILILKGNDLKHGPNEYLKYNNVTYLDLSNNKITSLNWIPPHIKTLNLKGNSLTILNPAMVKLLKQTENLEKLVLKDNPWSCSQCQSLDFQQSLKMLTMVNFSDVFCEDNETLLVKATISCGLFSGLYIISGILTAFLFCTLIFIIYYKNKFRIRQYLYHKNICCGLITNVSRDVDKKYDVFISYSHNDEQFVLEQILPKLEESNFRVCIHIRDWVPGKSIMSQIAKSVQNSKRTIVVLSEQFTYSKWGLMEFRTAHVESTNHKRPKVIVLILGDLNENCLNDEIKSYLKTNMYLKWGDEYFWKKLEQALPRPSCRERK